MSSLDFTVPLDSPMEGMSQDFVVRSLRRRLWRAFQQDDAETALRAYQATFGEFQKWIEEEEDEKLRAEEEANGNSKSPRQRRRKETKDDGRPRSRSRSRARRKRRSSLERAKSKRPSLEDAMPGTMISTADIHRSTRSILQSRINPSEPFIADDFLSPYASYDKPAQKSIPNLKKEQEKNIVRKQKQHKPRSAFNMFSLRKDLKDVVELNQEEETAEVFQEDVNMTTPLHEAARLGAGALMRFLLASGGDANVKNGHLQTSLHVCCGGVSKEEHRMIVAMNAPKDEAIAEEAGIRAPVISKEVLDLMNAEAGESSEKKRRGKKGVLKFKAVGKMLMRTNTKPKVETNEPGRVALKPKLDFNRLHDLAAGRIDAALTLLSWSHKQTGAGVSLNAVDDIGRTSLHYAAEMGRAEICNSIMANFGTLFTIVDEIGSRTPCECAARHGHKDLAAQLEARALLYVDPYGLDEELMQSVESQYMEDEDGNSLAPPYNWFKTLTTKNMEEERKNRLANGRDRLLNALQQYESSRDKKLEAKLRAFKEKAESANNIESLMETAAEVGLDFAVADRADGEARKTEEEDSWPDFSNMQDAHIERLFAYHRWDTFEAVDDFRKNPVRAFRKAQIQLPSEPKQDGKLSGDRRCLICIDDIEKDEKWLELEGCPHAFCTDCLKNYVMDCAKAMTPVSKFMCPQHGCTASISQANLDTLLANLPKTAARVGEATTRHFVSSAYDFKFCNAPGCSGVVKRLPQKFFVKAGYDPDLHDYFGAVCTAGPRNRCPPGSSPTLTYDGVEDSKYNNCKNREQPQRAHRFCFACGDTMHWPCPCDKLKEWQRKMREEIGEVEEGEAVGDANELAQRMWIKANTRSCPQCDVLIEKNDGCNHMTCVNPNCRYEFCWICRKDWKLHGSATGGFFRCNIWKEEEEGKSKETLPAEENAEDGENDQGYGTAIHSAREGYRKKQDVNRFLHHYTRYEAHDQSAALERKMAETASTRLAPVVDAAIEFDGSPGFNFGGKGLSFIHSAFTELLECRSTLRYSYPYSFFRYPTFFHFRRIDELNQIRKEKILFEKYQSELEMITEQMSDVLARSHIRASQVQITFLTAGAAEKRVDFSNLMFAILHEERGKDRQRREDDPTRKTRRSNNSLNPWTGSLEDRSDYSSDDDYDPNLQAFVEDELGYGDGNDGPAMWACSACTFMNTRGRRCEMCGTSRTQS